MPKAPNENMTQGDFAGMRCSDPHCKMPHNDSLALSGVCHPSAPTITSYIKSSNTIEIRCVVCKGFIASVKVAKDEIAPVISLKSKN